MISLWMHIPVVLGLLTLHGCTVYWAVRRIRALQDALHARAVILDEDGQAAALIVANGTMVLTINEHVRRLRVWSRTGAEVKVTIE